MSVSFPSSEPTDGGRLLRAGAGRLSRAGDYQQRGLRQRLHPLSRYHPMTSFRMKNQCIRQVRFIPKGIQAVLHPSRESCSCAGEFFLAVNSAAIVRNLEETRR